MKALVVSFLFLLGHPALSHAQAQALWQAQNNPVACSGIDNSARVGTVCATSKGFQFKRYQNPTSKLLGWQDLKGRVWYDAKPKKSHWPFSTPDQIRSASNAERYCKALNLEVPSGYP